MGAADRVCVIGAGSAGITACRALKVRGIPFDCFERAPEVGGLWRYPVEGGGSCAYHSLFANTSKHTMEYPSFPMPKEYPHYSHHSLVARYFDDFVEHFELRPHIRFGTEAEHVEPRDGRFEVRLADGAVHEYAAVIVASGGRHGEPVWPELPGEFAGRQLHAWDYDGPEELRGKRVLVVGLGASAADIASEVAHRAERTYLAVRTGHYIVPKIFAGQPTDHSSPLVEMLPLEARRPLLTFLLRFTHGRMTDHGLPAPPYKPGQAPLIGTSDLLPAIAHGRVVPKPQVERLEGERVRFADGSEHEVDVIVYCTGYRIRHPFLDPALVPGGDDAPPLYRLVVPPGVPGLYFVGLLHSMTAAMPLAEAQSEWVAEVVEGSVRLPPTEAMWKAIWSDRARQDKRFYNTSRHLLVEPHEYVRLMGAERKKWRVRGRPARPAPVAVAPASNGYSRASTSVAVRSPARAAPSMPPHE